MKNKPNNKLVFAKPTEPMRRIPTDKDRSWPEYVDPKHEKIRADGWIRLREILENAKQDERIAASSGAADFLELVCELAADSLKHEDAMQVLRPLANALAGTLLESNEGRHKGGATMAAKKSEHIVTLENAVLPLLKNPATSDWSNPQIAKWLTEKGFHKHCGIELGLQTMTGRVSEIRKKYKAEN